MYSTLWTSHATISALTQGDFTALLNMCISLWKHHTQHHRLSHEETAWFPRYEYYSDSPNMNTILHTAYLFKHNANLLLVAVAMDKCDPTTQNESHWSSITIQNVTIFDLQVKNIDFRFSSKSGASGNILFENITLNGQMWCFMTVSGILTAVIL